MNKLKISLSKDMDEDFKKIESESKLKVVK